MHDAHTAVIQYDLTGKQVREVQLPTIGSAWAWNAEAGERDAFLLFTSFAYGTTVLHVDLDNGTDHALARAEARLRSQLHSRPSKCS